MGKEKRCQYEVDRRHTSRKHEKKKESREQIRKGLGACIFVLGIPFVIAGLIITIVAYTNDDASVLPGSFPVLGPVLIVLAVFCFVIGGIMTNMICVVECCQSCPLNRSSQFCWKNCPKLFSIMYPDEVVRIQQMNAGLSALQTVPSKPALKRPVSSNNPNEAKPHHPKHGVHFTPNESYDGARTSTSSDPNDLPVLSDADEGQRNSSSSSVLSLRHFRIGPSEETTWVELRHAAPVLEHVSFEYVTEYGSLVNGGNSAYSQSQTDCTNTVQSTVKHSDNHNGGITEPKWKKCDEMVLQTVVSYV
ncbi:uncharacterized protein LOC121379987 [Gigantopelta aegis]|uniref:uncharacterized protein LOC121379987 n=1 Tax=Gigantopelta aegis TaxID=1735272 RepID=UPI001B88A1E1|nr:uncharacterized protein LOC121379987 [Gigantopelta aegis]